MTLETVNGTYSHYQLIRPRCVHVWRCGAVCVLSTSIRSPSYSLLQALCKLTYASPIWCWYPKSCKARFSYSLAASGWWCWWRYGSRVWGLFHPLAIWQEFTSLHFTSRTQGTPNTTWFVACLTSLTLWSCSVALRFILWPTMIGSLFGFCYNGRRKITYNQITHSLKFWSTDGTFRSCLTALPLRIITS